MTRVLGRLMSLEMIVLGLCELALSFLVIYAMLTLPGAFPVLTEAQGVGAAQTASLGTANLAAVLALTIVLTAAAIGLYRPEICIERRRLLINAGVAGLLAFPAVLVVNGSFNIGLPRHAVLLLSKVLLVWLVCILASRVIFNHVMRERWFIRRILVLGSAPHIARLRQLATWRARPAVRAGGRGAGGRRGRGGPVAVARRAAATAHLGHRHRRRAHRSEFPAGGRIAGLQVARRAGVRSRQVSARSNSGASISTALAPTGCCSRTGSPTDGPATRSNAASTSASASPCCC